MIRGRQGGGGGGDRGDLPWTWLASLVLLSLSAAVAGPSQHHNHRHHDSRVSCCGGDCDVGLGSPLSSGALLLDDEEDGDESQHRRLRRAAFVPYRRGAEVAEVVSRTLDMVLDETNYDKQVRPAVSKWMENLADLES